MRIAHTADWHVNCSVAGRDRYDEIVAFREAFTAECQRRQVDLVVHAGDWSDPGSDELRDQVRIAESCEFLASAARLGLVTVPGNHDVVLGTEDMSVLTPMQRVYRSGLWSGRVAVLSQPTVALEDSGVWIVAAPYPHDTRDYRNPDGAYHQRLTAALSSAPDSAVVVVVSHLYLRCVVRGNESDEMCRGDDCYLPDYAIEAADVVLQGHYHLRQQVTAVAESGATCKVLVAGSPIRHTFGERDDEHKGWWFVDLGR